MKKQTLWMIIGSVCLAVLSLCVGPKWINPLQMDEVSRQILLSIRLPRVILSLLMGGALGASGAVLQGILRNPLADPYILGISSGAALLAALGLLLGSTAFGFFTIPVFAFVGAVLTGIAVGAMGYRSGGLWPESLLLAGVGVGFLFSSLLMLMMSLSSDEGMRRAILWIFGDLAMADWSLIPYGFVLILIGLILSLWRAKGLNALMLGDDIAHSLGFNPGRERWILFLAVGLMTAASVSMGGVVGFIGLLVPHIIRFVVGSDNRVLIPLSVVAGGALLCTADTIGRTAVAPMELPSGIITAVLGAPYFLYLLKQKDILGES